MEEGARERHTPKPEEEEDEAKGPRRMESAGVTVGGVGEVKAIVVGQLREESCRVEMLPTRQVG